MIIVCDSSPIFALALCDKLDVLDTLYHEVVIPGAVYNEMTVPGKTNAEKIAEWAREKIVYLKDRALLETLDKSLHLGEAEAIALYKERKSDILLIDERRGRKIAQMYSIKIMGSLGLLLEAKEKGLLSQIRPYLDIIQTSNVGMSKELYNAILQRAGE